MSTGRQRWTAALLFAAIVVLGWFCYAPALGGAFLLDDVSNLSGLASIDDGLSALIFIFSGTAGPLGRPLALATFVPEAASWGVSAAPFLRINILIHLANACLLAWVFYRVSMARRAAERPALFVAVSGAALWLFMPLLASASLMVIQRMTTFSAFFVLLGLAGYLQARRSIEERPLRALIGMSVSLVAGTILAMFTKENGVLLPTFVLVLEATLLSRPVKLRRSHWQAWKAVFLLLPTVAILGYLVLQLPYGDGVVLRRDFTGWERLLTESRILWQYLFHAFIPQPGQFGPFHDGHPVAGTIANPLTLLAFAGWLVTLSLALLWRRRYPLFAFAVLWFLGGQLLESTVIPLELYFEHRNYLPIVGPVFALCALVAQIPVKQQRLMYAGVSAYILVNALVLFSFASLWGDPPAAARYWQKQFPHSVRAAQEAVYYTSGDGPKETLQALHRLVSEHPEAGFVKIRELDLSCIIAPRQDHRQIVAELRPLLKDMDYTITALTMLKDLLATVHGDECNGVTPATVGDLAHAILGNPKYANDALYNQLYEQLMALISQYEGKLDQRIGHIKKAIEYRPSSTLNKMMVVTYVDERHFDLARAFIEKARGMAPAHPMQRYLWLTKLDGLSHYVDEQEQRLTSGQVLH